MDSNKKVSVLIPCYNEEASLPLLYDSLVEVMNSQPSYDWEILLVNDGSRDGSIDVIKSLREKDERVNYVNLSRNFGKENALLAGFDYVTGDCTVIMDADLQHPPKLIPEMLKYWEEGYDDVYGKRLSRGKESWLRARLTKLFYSTLSKSSRFDVLQNVGDFRLLDRSCVEALKQLRETDRYTKGMYCWIGFRKKAVEFETADRKAGTSSMTYKSLFNLAIEGITSFTTSPLRISAVVGLTVSVVAFIYMIYVLVKTIIWGDPMRGFPTLVIVILFLGGVQLLSLGIIGEYLGRVFNETKNRPPYIAREYNGKRVM
jgi:glycosyltransferase involved in cell wall biosynthesis